MNGNLDLTNQTTIGWTALWELRWPHPCRDACSLELMVDLTPNEAIELASRSCKRGEIRDCDKSAGLEPKPGDDEDPDASR